MGVGRNAAGSHEPDRTDALGTTSRTPERIPLESLLRSDSPRVAGENAEHAGLLAQVSEPLPPILVHRRSMRVIDGMHRLEAARIRGDAAIPVLFVEDEGADPFVLAVEANREHGLPLSLADRRAAARRIIVSHPEWSDRRVAAVIGLAAATVASIRRCSTAQPEQLNARVGKDGKARPRDGGAGRRRAGELLAQNPSASLRAIAGAAGVSPATVKDVRARLARGEAPDFPQRSSEAAGEAVPDVPLPGTAEPAELIANLRRDPSLRFTEFGRALIRFLDSAAIDPDQRDELIRSVPPHQRETVVRLAREYARTWEKFADQLGGEAGREPRSA
ncbi:streptomycin biosynthesis protein [Lentzea sp. NPDC058450]|uniref:ParB/RepB/Spo0J family partition protein n=1 Tax=Lentzea sp. NPDC058450 TaxID=3346505 RepID=UPI00364A0717